MASAHQKRRIKMKRITSVLLSIILLLSTTIASASTELADVADYLTASVPNPQIAAVGGEWTIIGLARSGVDIPDEYYADYYAEVEKYVKAKEGILHEKKYTEYSRVIIALTAIGKDPSDVAGYNLLTPLADYEKTVWQGINGPVWALIALDCGGYDIPQNPDAEIWATREFYIRYILDAQLPDGGWALSGDISDPDITGMVLQALAGYQDNAEVKAATGKALSLMSAMQNADGGFSSGDKENSESCTQMLVALCELGIPLDDARFVKNGNTILDAVLSYRTGNSFMHTRDGGSNIMATEQCFYAMVAAKRMQDGRSSLYKINDAEGYTASVSNSSHPDVKISEITAPGKTFDDITGHEAKYAIESLSSRGIITGKTDKLFEPDSTMTRAEYATIVVRGLGLPVKNSTDFADVTEDDWFFDFVGTAHFYGIVNGVSDTEFNPNGTITREEAAVMTARAAKLCGMDNELDEAQSRDVLAGFLDYIKASDWAVTSLAFCYDEGILPDDVMEIQPMQAITRAEVAQMLFNMLF